MAIYMMWELSSVALVAGRWWLAIGVGGQCPVASKVVMISFESSLKELCQCV